MITMVKKTKNNNNSNNNSNNNKHGANTWPYVNVTSSVALDDQIGKFAVIRKTRVKSSLEQSLMQKSSSPTLGDI